MISLGWDCVFNEINAIDSSVYLIGPFLYLLVWIWYPQSSSMSYLGMYRENPDDGIFPIYDISHLQTTD